MKLHALLLPAFVNKILALRIVRCGCAQWLLVLFAAMAALFEAIDEATSLFRALLGLRRVPRFAVAESRGFVS
jgi:hypothetical protein